ncbi:MAG: hypothetical protein V9G04_00145 [Nocardioides sp.]|jgi:hypothetical protein
MYGDTDQIRRLAGGLESRARTLDELAADLLAATHACIWEGAAADAMRARVHSGATRLAACARRHEDAAAALRTHADAVDETVALIARIENRVEGLAAAARSRVTGLLDLLPGDLALATFVPPPSGHIAWLSVDLPGIAA